MLVAARVMTHPARSAELGALLERLGPRLEPVVDVGSEGPWPTARRCWRAGVDSGASHVLVLQDDVRVCADFWATLKALVAARPAAALSLHGRHGPFARAASAGLRWVASRRQYTGIAHVLPRECAAELLDWTAREAHRWHPREKSDARFRDFVRGELGQALYVPVPHPVDHRSDVTTLLPDHRSNAYWSSPSYGGDDALLAGLPWHELTAMCECGRVEAQCAC
jgi:hypothetical protein